MASAATAKASAARHANALSRKLGPLPAWAWAIVAGGALYWYRNRGSSSAAAGGAYPASAAPQSVNPDTGLPWNINPDTGQPYGGSGGDTGTGGGNSSGGDLSQPSDPAAGLPGSSPAGPPELGQPAPAKKKKHKPPRRRRIGWRRKAKQSSPGHGKHRGHPPHRTAKPKAKHVPRRHKHRDRQGVAAGAGTPVRAGRIRGLRTPKAGAGQHAAGAPASGRSRLLSSVQPQGGRSHEGGQDHRAGQHGRNEHPPAQGQALRRRPSAAPAVAKVPRQEPAHRAAESHEKAPKSSKRRRK